MSRTLRVALLLCGVILAGERQSSAEAGGVVPASPASPTGAPAAQSLVKPDASPKTVCTLIEAAATANGIPVDFFTRLIWKESTFRPTAVSPKGAQGIAQFMPGTASLRRLSDPFDPEEAIPVAAAYLRDLVVRFGNIGLAAAAYNAGERRVSDWLAGEGGLPYETQDYVLSITGRPAEDWTTRDPNLIAGGPPAKAKQKPPQSCLIVAAALAKPGAGSVVVESIPKGPWAPWGVQVAGNFSLNRAMASFALVQRKFPAIVTGPPMVVRKVSRSRGPAPLFQIRLPAPDQKQANDICHRLEAAGGACIVFRN
jgi:hypothetical protein